MRLFGSHLSDVLVVTFWTCCSVSHALVNPSAVTARPLSLLPSTLTPSSLTNTRLYQSTRSDRPLSSSSKNNVNVDDIKADIERMRHEALQRLETLNEQMHQAEQAWNDQNDLEHKKQQQQQQHHDQEAMSSSSTLETNHAPLVLPVVEKSTTITNVPVPPEASSSSLTTTTTTPTTTTGGRGGGSSTSSRPPLPHATEQIHAFEETTECDALLRARMEREKMHFVEHADKPTVVVPMERQPFPLKDMSLTKSSLKLLDDTRWRLMLNIGREQGTWMPKTWGASGDRLRMHLELEFSPDQLYERDEFLNGVSGAKVLKVIHSEAQVSPTMTQGGRSVRLGTTGGWRVAPNEGPMGTSVLRFYVDLQQETRHAGSDVYCPAGRIYCTCGYFSMVDRHQEGYVSEKEALKQEMRRLEVHYSTLAAEQELDQDLVSWDKFQRSKTMMELRMRATKLNTKLHEAQIREPDRSLLRLSQDQQVGLTREGGVCCKVNKGLAIEYHILGKFEVASMTNREHSDYRELLP